MFRVERKDVYKKIYEATYFHYQSAPGRFPQTLIIKMPKLALDES